MTERFAEANVLFVLDQLIKGVHPRHHRPARRHRRLPARSRGCGGLVGFINAVIRMSLTYVDEIILGYNIRMNRSTPFETARQGVVLYAQNGKTMVKNAIWLTVIHVDRRHRRLPADAGAGRRRRLRACPGQLAGWAFVLAIVFAWAFKAAFIEPFAIAALMQVYFKTIEGQAPNPEWDRRLAEASSQVPGAQGQGAGSLSAARAGRSRRRLNPVERPTVRRQTMVKPAARAYIGAWSPDSTPIRSSSSTYTPPGHPGAA